MSNRPPAPRRDKPAQASGGARAMPPSVEPRSHQAIGPSAEQRQRTGATEAPQRARPDASAPRRRAGRVKRFFRVLRTVLVVVLIAALVAVVVFWRWVDDRIIHTDALSGAADTPGETYLIVGSDSREGWRDEGVEGERADTIVVLHRPVEGPTALISIPRDSYVAIPGHGMNKINAAFAYGGPALLVETVEGLTGLTVDRYLEVGFNGVIDVVDALGGVELCYDRDVNDEKSHLKWEAGCHVASGKKALAFARMRYADPLGDIGRTDRQRQLATAVVNELQRPGVYLNPFTVVPIASAGLDAFRVSDGTTALDLAGAMLDFKSATGDDAVTGTPPIATLDYRVGGVGSAVLLDPAKVDRFWAKVAAGDFKAGATVGGLN